MKTCPVCGMVVGNPVTRCGRCYHIFTPSDEVGITAYSGNLGKLNNPPQKVRISTEGELCWVPLNDKRDRIENSPINDKRDRIENSPINDKRDRIENSPAVQLARERAAAAKALIAARKAAEARQEKN